MISMTHPDKLTIISEYRTELSSISLFIEKLYSRLEGKDEIDPETQNLIQTEAIDKLKTLHSRIQDFLKNHEIQQKEYSFAGASINGHLSNITRMLEDLRKGKLLNNKAWPNHVLSDLRDYHMALEILMRNL